jgi:hypothetical protein
MAGRRALVAALLLATLALAPCSASPRVSLHAGHIFAEVTSSAGITTSPPGDEWGFQAAWLRNATDHPITLLRATVVGRGVGTVVQVVSIEVTPFPAATGFRNVTRPPVFDDHGTCLLGHLSPVDGYVLRPNAPPVTLFVVMRSAEPGTFNVGAHVVTYESEGLRYQETQHEGVYGRVAIGAPALKPYPEEKSCLHLPGVELLPTSAPPPN